MWITMFKRTRKALAVVVAPVEDRSHEELRALYLANAQEGKFVFDGFQRSEISAYNRRLMFGENDEAFPSDAEWKSITD